MSSRELSAWNDPLERLAGRLRRESAWEAPSLAAALLVHTALGFAFALFALRPARRPEAAPPIITQVVDIELPKPAPAPEPPAPAPTVPAAAPPPAPAAKAVTAQKAAAAPPPAPAQAAAVVTREADPSEPVDLSSGFVIGTGTTYAGGSTSSAGTSKSAVRGATVSAGGVPYGTGVAGAAAPAAAGPDRSRKPVMAGSGQWKCPFPREADADQVDSAVATIRVDIDAAGAPRNVVVLSDPGHGFGREAQRCATSKRWSPALDHQGTPVEGTVKVNVRFDR